MTGVALPKQKYRLDVGCGSNKQQGWLGMDKRSMPSIDIVHDAEDVPWPLPDNSCSVILMAHLWEHLKPWKTIDVMNEMWRVLEPDGQLQLTMPYGWSFGFVQDPTHCNPANETTWEYFDPQYDLYKVYRPKPWLLIKPPEFQAYGNMLVVMNVRKTEEEGKEPEEIPRFDKTAWRTERSESEIVDEFHALEYEKRTLTNHALWMGQAVDKAPVDLWNFQEIIFEVKPRLIVELGTANGASALYFAHLLDLIGKGRIITVDIDEGTEPFAVNPSRTNPGERPSHPRIQYLIGSSLALNVAKMISEEAAKKSQHPVMVILDSDHAKNHVLKELEAYAPLVTKGSYLIVEDGNINGHPVYPEYGPGPYEALLAWLPNHPEFDIDKERENRFYYTHNPMGWLRRVR